MPKDKSRKQIGLYLMAGGALLYIYSVNINNGLLATVSLLLFFAGFFLVAG